MAYVTTTIKLTRTQAHLVMQAVVPTPWYRRGAKACEFRIKGLGGELEFQLETNSAVPHKQPDSDYRTLMDGMLTCRTFGWSRRTSEQIRTKLRRAAEAVCKETN